MVLIGLGVAYITILNKKHAARRAAMGKAAEVVDVSMEDANALREKGEVMNAEHGGLGEKAFDDVTDLKNEDFIYLY